MSNFAFVLNSNKQPLNPIHPGAARRLLKAGKAAVYLLFHLRLSISRRSVKPQIRLS